jgi:hypothetical protein
VVDRVRERLRLLHREAELRLDLRQRLAGLGAGHIPRHRCPCRQLGEVKQVFVSDAGLRRRCGEGSKLIDGHRDFIRRHLPELAAEHLQPGVVEARDLRNVGHRALE